MSGFTAIDLSALPPPDVVETLDYEDILAALVADYAARYPQYAGSLESDPAMALMEVAAYREMLLRARINDAALAVMLSSAAGSDLDQLGALYNVQRLIITPADPDAIPPVTEVLEADERFRARIQLAPESWTTAGSVGAYTFHALSADARVADAGIFAPESGGDYTGAVTVTVLPTDSDADVPTISEIIAAVTNAVSADTVRPLTDRVTVQAPSVVHDYTVDAALTLYDGPSAEEVRKTAEDAVTAYTEARYCLGHDVTLSGLFGALHQPGVQNVALTLPAADVVVDHDEVAVCSGITVTVSGTGE